MIKPGYPILLLLAIVCPFFSQAQESELEAEWDNIMYVGNKVTWGPKTRWKNSAELQFRLQDNTRQLQQYFVEYVGTYFLNKNVELVPDFRIAIKPDRVDYRPGFGVVLKHIAGKAQFVHQIKYQTDYESTGGNSNTLRYFPSYNQVLGEHWIISAMAGGYYKFDEPRNDFSAFVVGIGGAYFINKQHTINLTYLYAEQQNIADEFWFPAGGVILRLIININKDFEYLPAKYINF